MIALAPVESRRSLAKAWLVSFVPEGERTWLSARTVDNAASGPPRSRAWPPPAEGDIRAAEEGLDPKQSKLARTIPKHRGGPRRVVNAVEGAEGVIG